MKTMLQRRSLAVAAAILGLSMVPAHSLAAREPSGQEASTRGLYLDLIRQARQDGRPRAALAFLDDFDRQYSSDVEAIVLRINCLLDLGSLDEARIAARRLPQNERAARLGAEAARGHVSAAFGEWGVAVRHYRAAIAAKPADATLFNALGYAQIRAGSAREAVATLRSASELAPDSPVIRNNLMLALLLGGEVSAVREALARIPDAAERSGLEGQLRTESEDIARALSLSVAPAAPQGDVTS